MSVTNLLSLWGYGAYGATVDIYVMSVTEGLVKTSLWPREMMSSSVARLKDILNQESSGGGRMEGRLGNLKVRIRKRSFS